MLYRCYDEVAVQGKDFAEAFAPIRERYNGIISDLGLSLSLDEEFEKIGENFRAAAGSDYAASRGEYLNGIVLANYLGFEFIDAARAILRRNARRLHQDFLPRRFGFHGFRCGKGGKGRPLRELDRRKRLPGG